MDKVIRQTTRAIRVKNRKIDKTAAHKERGEAWAAFQQKNRLVRANGANIKNARINRQIDHDAGTHLAPRRDVGDKTTTYGSMSLYDITVPELRKHLQPHWVPFSEGDRVVVLQGRDKGRIGEVTEVMRERGHVRVKGVNVIDVKVPEWMNREDNSQGEIQGVPRTVPMEDVRLVYPLPDPETGIPRDVIIDRLVRVNYSFDKSKGEWTDGDRLIPGTNTLIPWPVKADPEYEDFEDDTLRITVEEQTFRPYLLYPPMPSTVIDELRNKFSRYRTRHDWQYEQKKELEDQKTEKRKELVKGMRTPLQELAESRRVRKEEEGERELSEEQLEAIGQVIAQERSKVVGAVRGRLGSPRKQETRRNITVDN
ncbi:hypothetical protein LTS10_000882 [Elasticomyces elasticus]|nr:hypothetical protein LTS10_000882 [Elasticomyces elasticus]